MKRIPLTQGKVALVSDRDYHYLMQWKWCYAACGVGSGKGGYAIRRGPRPVSKTIYMHAVVAARKGLVGKVDHSNRNKLDNQRRNLRSATQSQNQVNHDLHANNGSGYRGVTWHLRARKWQAYITVQKHFHYLGLYPATNAGKVAAARRYNTAARKYFGSFAVLNPV